MKTTYTTMAIFAAILFTQNVEAKLGENRSTVKNESRIELNVEAEIVNNINMMLANVKAPTIKADVAKQLNIGTVQFKTNELVQNVSEKLPEFKFKVIITD